MKEIEGFFDQCTIYAFFRVSGGGFGISTVDISKNETMECEPEKSGPPYRTGCNGLNIQSNCKNRNCEVYNDTAYI